MPKEIIPSSYLYYPRYVGSSPYKVIVSTGPSIAAKCTATGTGLTTAKAGKLAEIDIVSRDFASAPLDNQNDNYEITLSNIDGSTDGNLAVTATYVAAVGQYKATYVPTKAGTYTMNIKLLGEHIKNSPFTVIVSTGDISAVQSTTDISTPITVIAGDTYFFTFNAKDLFGSTITTGGQSEEISIMAYFQTATAFDSPIGVADLTNWEYINGKDIAGVIQDLGDGTYSGQVTILKAAAFTLDVQVNDVSMTGSPFSPLTVSPSEIYAPQSVPATTPTTAVAGVQTTFKVQGRDFYGNNAAVLITSVTSTTIELRNSATNTLVVSGTITDDASNTGVYDIAFTPTLSGSHILNVKIEGKHISGSPFTITVDPEATTDLSKTTITAFGTSYQAGDKLEFTIEARDSYSNLRTASTAEIFTVKLTDSDSVVTTITPVAQGDGTYTVSQLLSKVSTYTLTVNDSTDSISVASSPYTGITVSPGNVVAMKSLFNTAPTPISAGTQYTYKVEARDLYSNTVSIDSTSHKFFLSLYSSDTMETQTFDMAYQFGLYEADITLTDAGSYNMVIGVTRNSGLRATYYATVSFYEALKNTALHYHTGLEPTHYTQIDETVNIDSDYLSVHTGMPSQYFSIQWEGKIKAPHSGKFRFYIHSDEYYTLKLTIGGEVLIDLNVASEGVISSGDHYYADKILVIDTLYDITIEYSERIGKSEIEFYWESDQIAKQIVPKEYLFHVLYSENTPTTIVVEPLATSASNVVLSGDYAQAISGVQETITLEARDTFDNLQIHQSDVFSVVLTHTATSTTVTGVVTAQSNGVYQATYTLTNKGEHTMAITVQSNGSGSFTAITGSPFAVTCADSLTDVTKTQMTGTALTSATAGEVMSFTVTLYDAQSNPRTAGGDTITATLLSSGLISVGTTWVTDNNDGTYTVQYEHDTLGTYTIEIVVNSDTANKLTSTIVMSPGLPNPSASTLTHPSISTIGTATTISIVAKDAFSNLVTSQVYDIAYEVIGNHGLVSGTVPVTTLASAAYDTTYTIPTPTGTTSSTCGTLGVKAYFVYQGLTAKYYANRWFTGTPAITKIESQVNVNWESGEIIPNVASDYVSVVWSGYLKPTYSEAYTFTIRSNDGVKLTVGNQVIINKLISVVADGSSITSTSTSITLTANSLVPIKVEYYEITGKAFIVLEWSSSSQAQQVIPTSQFYTPSLSSAPITGATISASSIYSPMKVLNVAQGDSSTYAQDSLTITWTAPTDYGCESIDNYKVTLDDGTTPVDSTVGAVTTTTISSLTAGQAYTVTVLAINSVGEGIVSASVILTPATLPTAPASISVTLYEKNALTLSWPVPTDTGKGDTSLAITNYLLEVDEGYGNGFETLVEQTSTTYQHTGLIAGRTLKYRVSAKNFLGYGPTSTEYSFSPVVAPAKPENPPRNDATQTSQTAIHVEYDAVTDDGGSVILNYNIYIDDGADGAFGAAINNGLALTYDTSSLSLVAGNTYRFKYSAVNSQGEGEISDEVAILLAELPGAPQNFARIDESTLSAGIIRVYWEVPTSNGGTDITGYKIYQDTTLIYEATNVEYTYTITGLTIGTSYSIGVSAVNAVGEGTKSETSMLAASVPAKMSRPTLKSSSQTTIEVQWSVPSFDGGDSITGYLVQRDNGPGTAFQTAISTTNLYYEFTGLSNALLTYRIQVAAVNSLGSGEYSTPYSFYAASTPGAPATLSVSSQSTSQISLAWTAPASNGGCSIEGYKLWMEDVVNPGYKLIYNGSKNSAVLSYSVTSPTISASKTYNFQIAAIA